MSLRHSRTRFAFLAIALFAITAIAFASTWNGGLALFAPEVTSARVTAAPKAAPAVTLNTCDTTTAVLPIEIEATAGVAGPIPYATLGAAFAAINAGTHQGVVSVEVCFSSVEGTTPANLNSSGAGSALYTAVNIYPLADGISISGNPITGFGVVQLNGADNVTIDGDNSLTAGTNRNLTISNTTTNTVIANSAVRIATSAAVTSADNNTIRNLALLGNVTSGNAAAITLSTSSSNSSFGIYVGGNGGATATTAPTAITSVTAQTAPSGTTVNNLLITNNSISQAARAIVFNGAAASVSTGVTISNNLIGDQGTATPATPPFTSPATTVYTKGIWVAGTTSVSITGNTLKNIISYVATTITAIELLSPVSNSTISNNTVDTISNNGTSSITKGILLSNSTVTYLVSGNIVTNVNSLASSSGTDGIEATTTASTSGTIEKNKVSTVYGRSAGTFGAYGINVTAGTGINIRNNFVSDVNMNMTGGGAFSSQFSVHGIRIAGGTNHRVYHNTVSLSSALLGTATTSIMTSALCITATSITGMDVRNNILANTITGGTTSIAHVSLSLPTNAASAMTLTLNNNDYFSGTDAARQGIGQGGVTPGTGFYLASNFNPAVNTPATNLRALTTLLGPATNDNASQVVDPVLVSTTDLHIQPSSPVESDGVDVGITTDIDNEARGTVPDIGADEITIVAPGTLQLSSATYGGNEGTTLVATVNRVAGTTGIVGATYTLADVSAVGGAACAPGVDYENPGPQLLSFGNGVSSQPINVVLCTDLISDIGETFTITLSAPTGGATLGSPTVATATIGDVAPPFNGTFTVGTGGNYPSLTNPGGIFQAINLSGATGNITIDIVSDLAGETGTHALNEIAGGFTVLIRPSGAPRTVSGTSTVYMIPFNGTDSVTFDGSLSGGTDRSLTVTNTSSGGVIGFTSGAAGAQGNTLKNVNVVGGSPTTTLIGVAFGGNTFGTAGVDNDNNRIENNTIRRTIIGLYSAGASAANPNTGTVITRNDLTGTGADRVSRTGMLFFNDNGLQVTENRVGGISSAEGIDAIGIGVGAGASDAQFSTTATTSGGIFNAVISRNQVNGVAHTSATGWGAAGITIAGDAAGPNTVSNNMITGVTAPSTSPDIPAGIWVAGVTGSTTRLYHNSVAMTGDRGAVGSQMPSFALAITGVDPTVELKDNIFYTTQVAVGGGANADSYTIGMVSTTFVNLDSNYNDFFFSGANAIGFRSGSLAGGSGTEYTTLAAWQAAITDDANSQQLDPVFINPASDVHLDGATTPLLGDGLTGFATVDFDNDPRPATGPDVGADEIVQAVGGTIPAGTYYNVRAEDSNLIGGNTTITNRLHLNGILSGNLSTLTLGCNATVTGASATNYFTLGDFEKEYCGPGAFSFPVGATGYSPVNVTVTAGTFPAGNPPSLTVRAFNVPFSPFTSATAANRNWALTESGDLTADLVFNYLETDTPSPGVDTDETDYRLWRRDQGAPTEACGTGCVDEVLNTATIAGQTSFSRWGIAGAVAPTAAAASLSGRVLTADGRGIRNVTMVIEGGNLTERRYVRTSSFGWFTFDELRAGETYVVTVNSRRYLFQIPNRVVTLSDSVTDVDFVAEPF